MCSVSDDRTARARIRDAALSRFARDGVSATTLRAVAADAGVSMGLVAHHFGSKDGLRRGVDDHVLALTQQWVADMGRDDTSIVGTMLERALEHVDAVRYLSRVLLDGAAGGSALFDQLVSVTETLLAEGEREGWVRPTSDERMRSALLTTWDLGTLVLADHVSRAIGDSVFDREGMRRWSRAALEMYSHGVLTDEQWLHPSDAAALHSPTEHTAGDDTQVPMEGEEHP